MERLVKTLTFKIGEETRPVKLNKDSYKDNLLSAQISKALGFKRNNYTCYRTWTKRNGKFP